MGGELLILTNDAPRGHLRDGDIISAWPHRAIEWRNAEILTHVKLWPKNGAGLNHGVPQLFYENSVEFRHSRVGLMTYEVFDLVSQTTIRTVNDPFLPAWVDQRLRHARHRIFGTQLGREVWYSGRRLFNDSRLNTLWTRIEENTTHRRSSNQRKIWGRQEFKIFLILPVVDFSEAVREELMELEFTTGVDPVPIRNKRFMPWHSLVLPRTQRQIRDRTLHVDIRSEIRDVSLSAVRTKA